MAYEQAQNIIPQGARDDSARAVQDLIAQNIANIKTAFLAKITAINGNRVSVQEIAKSTAKGKTPIINNVPIAQPLSGEWRIQFDLKVGDIGLCVVCESDISAFKYNDSAAFKVATNRKHDFNDSIFLPLSLNLQEPARGVNFKISDTNNKNYLIFKDGNLTIESEQITHLKARLFTMQSAATTLKTELIKLANILKSSKTASAGGHTHATFAGGDQSALSAWAAGLDNLFEN